MYFHLVWQCNLTDDGCEDIFLCTTSLCMGWSSNKIFVLASLPKNFCCEMVYAHYLGSRCIGLNMVHICDVFCHIRVSAGGILLAASFTATLHRFSEILLGKRYFQPPLRRHDTLFAYPYDMATADVLQEQDISNWRLCTRRFVSFHHSSHCQYSLT